MANQTSHAARPTQSPPLVGRQREQAALREALDAALAGRGSLILIGGEAGIGKTALAEATLAEAAARGARVLVGRCYDLSETPPYGPWSEALTRPPHDDDPLPSPDLSGGDVGSQAALFARTRDYVAALAARRPLVVLLDDLQWADPASLDLLRALARQLPALSVLLLATYRPGEVSRQHLLATALPLLVREARPARLELRPLPASELRALVRQRYALPLADEDRLVAYLAARSEGNPFYAGELLRSLVEIGVLCPATGNGWALGDLAGARLPLLLRQMLDARVDRLGADDRGLLAIAAVIGQEVPLLLWAAVALLDEEALLGTVERAAAAGLLQADDDGVQVRFAHALIREALYEGLLPPRRRIWHRRAAEALLAAGDQDADAVAHHLRRAGDPRAAAWLIRAGERAQRAFAWITATERYDAALALLGDDGPPDAERGWLLFRLAMLRRYIDPGRAAAALDAVARLAADLGDPLLAAHTLYNRGNLHCQAREVGRGLAEMEAAIAALEALPVDDQGRRKLERLGFSRDTAHHRGTLATWLAPTGHFDRAEAMARPVADRFDAIPPTSGLDGAFAGDALVALGFVAGGRGRPDEAHAAFARGRAAYLRLGNQTLACWTALHELRWAMLPYHADHLARRQALVAAAEAAWERARSVAPGLVPQFASLPLLVIGGEWEAARQAALLIRTGAGTPGQRLIAACALAIVGQHQGDHALAWEVVREALPGGPATAPGEMVLIDGLLLQESAAALALDAGDLNAARAWLTAHDDWLAWSGAALRRAEGILGWAAYHRAAGDLAVAEDLARRALAQAEAPRQPLALLAAYRLLGELAAAAGRRAEAAAHLDAALALAETCAAPYERALVLLALAELRAGLGESEAAEPLLDVARTVLAELGARPALARAEDLAMRIAAIALMAPERYPGGLTAREVEVLRLVAAGRSNREVAEALYLSTRTVERHIENLYRKIDAHGRADATAFALRHDLI